MASVNVPTEIIHPTSRVAPVFTNKLLYLTFANRKFRESVFSSFQKSFC